MEVIREFWQSLSGSIWFTSASFLFFTGLVAFLTWRLTRKEDLKTQTGYFLAGRSLTFPIIAGSLLLTNLSTEQMVGLNGDAFLAGLSVMVWEVGAVIALVFMALFFLPRFLKSGIATVPQFLEIRFDHGTQVICNLIFLAAYATILLPMVLYTGASGMAGILELEKLTGIGDRTVLLWLTVWFIGLAGSVYALCGGLRSVAVSDTLNGIGLLTGGFLITILGLRLIGGGDGIIAGLETLGREIPGHLNSIGGANAPVPFFQIFSGVMIINVFYWCTNQQIIQRTLAASSLGEGQKGVLLTAFLKLIGPLYLVLPGIMAYYLFVYKAQAPELRAVDAYGKLVNHVLPPVLTGFFAAVVVGAILSSFNSALNSTCTLFSLGLYKTMWKKDATELETVRAGKYFGMIIALIAMTLAPFLARFESIFTYLQTMNGIYNIPICAVVLLGLLNRRIPSCAAKIALAGGVGVIAFGYFGYEPLMRLFGIEHSLVQMCGGEYHFLGIVFVLLCALMLAFAVLKPRETPWVQQYTGEVDLTPWRFAVPIGIVLLVLVVMIYGFFADFSVLREAAADAAQAIESAPVP